MLFAVQSIALAVPFDTAYGYIAEARNLPEWTEAFASVSHDGSAKLRTPQGEAEISLATIADPKTGVIDWQMTFVDGSVALAHSRVVALGDQSCAYSFILTPPPVPLEELEGALAQQTGILERELERLKAKLEG